MDIVVAIIEFVCVPPTRQITRSYSMGQGKTGREWEQERGMGNHAHNEFELEMYCSIMSPCFAGLHR